MLEKYSRRDFLKSVALLTIFPDLLLSPRVEKKPFNANYWWGDSQIKAFRDGDDISGPYTLANFLVNHGFMHNEGITTADNMVCRSQAFGWWASQA